MDAQKSIEFDCMVRIIDKMCKQPSIIVPLHGLMQSHDLEKVHSLASRVTVGSWTGQYKQLDRIPKSWTTEYLLSRAHFLGLNVITHELLSKIEQDSMDALPMLFSFETQTVGAMAFPQQCSDKTICSKTFSKRAEQVGDRLKHLVLAGALGTEGKIDFGKGGCFTLKFAEGKLSELKHCTGVVAEVPSHVQITTAYTLVDNHLDHLARVELKPC
eukprot:7990333-Alexandrium_andersonii.AAC.1